MLNKIPGGPCCPNKLVSNCPEFYLKELRIPVSSVWVHIVPSVLFSAYTIQANKFTNLDVESISW